MENKDYVTIDLSKKQVDYDSARVNEKNGKEYVRVFAKCRFYFLPGSAI